MALVPYPLKYWPIPSLIVNDSDFLMRLSGLFYSNCESLFERYLPHTQLAASSRHHHQNHHREPPHLPALLPLLLSLRIPPTLWSHITTLPWRTKLPSLHIGHNPRCAPRGGARRMRGTGRFGCVRQLCEAPMRATRLARLGCELKWGGEGGSLITCASRRASLLARSLGFTHSFNFDAQVKPRVPLAARQLAHGPLSSQCASRTNWQKSSWLQVA